jgi:hypothetical protein
MLDGGFPRGRLSEVVGPRTSGRTSLILASLAQATAAGGLAALVDMTDGLDPASARARGVELGRLLWVRCGGRLRPGLAAADAILRGGGFEAVVVDLGELPRGELGQVAPAALVRLQRAVEGTPAALLFTGAQRVGGSLTSVAVAVTPGSVTWQPGGPGLFGGLVTEARLVRARGRPPGASVRLVWSVGRGWH